jgi:hypothetical protein
MRTLVICSGEGERIALGIMHCLAAADARLYLAGTRYRPAGRFSRHCRGFIRLDFEARERSAEAAAGRLDRFCRQHRVEVIIPADVPAAFFLADHGAALGAAVFPLPLMEVMLMLNNKWSFYQLLRELGAPTPHTVKLDMMEEVGEKARRFPLMVKPLELGNGRGVRRLDSLDELLVHLAGTDAFARLPLILQDYVEGEDVDLSLLAVNGSILAWTCQRWHRPGEMEFIEDQNILGMCERVISHVGYTGVAHFDLRVESATGKALIIECNPRFWGTVRASMLHGVNFPHVGSLQALGQAWEGGLGYRPGPYLGLERTARRLLVTLSLRHIPSASLRGLWEVMGDPVPAAYVAGVKAWERLRR